MSLEEKTKIIGTLSCIQFSFIILKLIGVNWSWLWVLSPLWIPILFVILVVIYTHLIFYKDVKKKVGKKSNRRKGE